MSQTLIRHPFATVKLIGDGGFRDRVFQMFLEDGLLHRVQMVGYVDPDRVQAELKDANVLVLLSDSEGMPGAVMDGMACGLVPVCQDIPGGIRDLVIHNRTGLLVTDRQESFQAAIDRLVQENGLLQRLSRAAHQHIKGRFSLESVVDRWEQLFELLRTEAEPRRPLRFPRRPVLPSPHPAFGSEDARNPPSPMTARLRHQIWRALRLARRITRRIVPLDSGVQSTNEQS